MVLLLLLDFVQHSFSVALFLSLLSPELSCCVRSGIYVQNKTIVFGHLILFDSSEMRIQSLLLVGIRYVLCNWEYGIYVTTKLSVNAFESMHIFTGKAKPIIFHSIEFTTSKWARFTLENVQIRNAKLVMLLRQNCPKNNGIFAAFVLKIHFERQMHIFKATHSYSGMRKSAHQWLNEKLPHQIDLEIESSSASPEQGKALGWKYFGKKCSLWELPPK